MSFIDVHHFSINTSTLAVACIRYRTLLLADQFRY